MATDPGMSNMPDANPPSTSLSVVGSSSVTSPASPPSSLDSTSTPTLPDALNPATLPGVGSGTSTSGTSQEYETSTSASPEVPASSWSSMSIVSSSTRLLGNVSASIHPTGSQSTASSGSTQTTTGITPPTAVAGATIENQSTVKPDHSPSDGVIGAIGAASAIGGALIVAAITFLLFRKRRRQSSAAEHGRLDSCQDHSDTFSGTTATAVLENPDPSPATAKDVDLLPPASDFELQEDFTRLNASIRSYVETFYTATSELSSLAQDHSAHLPRNHLDGLPELLSPACPLPELVLDTLLKTPRTRLPAIRFLIAWNILTNVAPSAPLSSTLLPPEIARCLEALEPIPLGPVSARPASPFRCPSPSSMRIVAEPATAADDWLTSLSKWRQVTGAAMAAIYSDGVEQQWDFRDARKANVSELTARMICVLQPLVVKGLGAARVKELERVVMRGAQVGWKLFVQPSTWRFGWTGSGSGDGNGNGEDGGFVVFPSLVKVGDENGVRLGRAVVVAEMEEAELGL